MAQKIAFILVGIGVTFVHYLIALTLSRYSVLDSAVLINTIAFCGAVIVGHQAHQYWTFAKKTAFTRYLIGALLVFIINTVLLVLIKSCISLDWIYYGLPLVLSPAISYLLMAKWTFK